MSYFFHPQSAAKHQHKQGPIPWSFYVLEKELYLLVFQMFGKPSGELHDIRLHHGVGDRDFLFFTEVVIKLAYRIQITVDGLRP
jgi:hypothetical protein